MLPRGLGEGNCVKSLAAQGSTYLTKEKQLSEAQPVLKGQHCRHPEWNLIFGKGVFAGWLDFSWLSKKLNRTEQNWTKLNKNKTVLSATAFFNSRSEEGIAPQHLEACGVAKIHYSWEGWQCPRGIIHIQEYFWPAVSVFAELNLDSRLEHFLLLKSEAITGWMLCITPQAQHICFPWLKLPHFFVLSGFAKSHLLLLAIPELWWLLR